MTLQIKAVLSRFARIMQMFAPARVEQARPVPVISREMMIIIMRDRHMRAARRHRY